VEGVVSSICFSPVRQASNVEHPPGLSGFEDGGIPIGKDEEADA
jgi:hypothetical protein